MQIHYITLLPYFYLDIPYPRHPPRNSKDSSVKHHGCTERRSGEWNGGGRRLWKGSDLRVIQPKNAMTEIADGQGVI